MAERDALIKTDHPFIMRLHYSFQVGGISGMISVGLAQFVFRSVSLPWRDSLGCDQVG